MSNAPVGRPGSPDCPRTQADTPRRWGQRSASGFTPTAAASKLRRVRSGASPARAGSTRSTRSARAKARSQNEALGSIASETTAITSEDGIHSSQAGSTTAGFVSARRVGWAFSKIVIASSRNSPP